LQYEFAKKPYIDIHASFAGPVFWTGHSLGLRTQQ